MGKCRRIWLRTAWIVALVAAGAGTSSCGSDAANLANLVHSWVLKTITGYGASDSPVDTTYLAIERTSSRQAGGTALTLLYDAGHGSFTLTGTATQSGSTWSGTFTVANSGPTQTAGVVARGATLTVQLTVSGSTLTTVMSNGTNTTTAHWAVVP